jgi:hypothetical protein
MRGKDVEIPVFDRRRSSVGEEINYSVFSGLSLERNLSSDGRLVAVVAESQFGRGRCYTGFNIDADLGMDNRDSSLQMVDNKADFLELDARILNRGLSSSIIVVVIVVVSVSFRTSSLMVFVHFKNSFGDVLIFILLVGC